VAVTVRTAGQVAHNVSRWLSQLGVQVGLTTVAPTTAATGLYDPTIAHGLTGSDDCVVSVGTNASFTANTTITLYVWSKFLGQWVTGGATPTRNSIVFGPGALDIFTIPEGSLFYLSGSNASAAGTIAVDGANPAGRDGL
jgi:hypothetical protein